MKNFINLVKSETKQLIKSPKRIFYTLIFPLLLFGFMSAIFYNGVPRDLPVAYLDHSQTQLSQKLVQYLDATSTIKMDKIVADENKAKELMQQGKIYGFIVIPEDFQKKIYQGLGTSAVCYTNNQFLLPAGLISKSFRQVVGTFSAGIKIKRETQKNVQSQKAIAEVQPVLTDVHTLFNPYTNYAFYLLTVLLPTMLQMIVIMVTIYVIGLQFKQKTDQKWFELGQKRPFLALFGKLLPYTLCLFFVGWWMNYLLFQRIGVPLKTGMINVVLMTFLLIVIYQLLGVAILSIVGNFRSALTIGSGFTAIVLSFTAYTFPIEGLPKIIQYLAQIFPFKHFMDYYVKRAIKGIPIDYSWHSILWICVFVLFFILAYPKFVKLLKTGGYGED